MELLQPQHGAANDAGIVLQRGNADIGALDDALAVRLLAHQRNQHVQEVISLSGDTAADGQHLGLENIDDVGELLDSVLADGPGSTLIDLDIDKDLLKSFIEKHNVSENVLFSSVIAYTLSRFVGSEKVSFNIIENGRDRFDNFDSVGMFVNTLPLLVDCKNQDISSFVEYLSDMVYGVIRYNYYPFRLLAKKYGIKSDILFQFL